MGMAVEKCEKPHDNAGHNHRRANGEEDHKSERYDRQCNAIFDRRKWNARHADSSAENHRAGEQDRQRDHQWASEEGTPDSDRNHREQMIEPDQGMTETRNKTARQASAFMSQRRSGHEH